VEKKKSASRTCFFRLFPLDRKGQLFHLVREDERVTKEDNVLGPLAVMRNYCTARRSLQLALRII